MYILTKALGRTVRYILRPLFTSGDLPGHYALDVHTPPSVLEHRAGCSTSILLLAFSSVTRVLISSTGNASRSSFAHALRTVTASTECGKPRLT